MSEYAVIGVAVVVAFIAAATLMQPLLKANLDDTRKGVDSEVLGRPVDAF